MGRFHLEVFCIDKCRPVSNEMINRTLEDQAWRRSLRIAHVPRISDYGAVVLPFLRNRIRAGCMTSYMYIERCDPKQLHAACVEFLVKLGRPEHRLVRPVLRDAKKVVRKAARQIRRMAVRELEKHIPVAHIPEIISRLLFPH
jgi:hypothetical protein